jgi:hypothetical protein
VLLRHSRASASGAVVVKVNGEENRGEARTEEEERRSSFGGALLLKPHKAVDDGGAAPRLWAANNGSEVVGVCKVAATAVQTCSAPPGRLCSDRETDGWAPRGFDFFQFIQNWLNFKNSKWVSYLAPKISNFCMPLAYVTVKKFLYCANIQFPT